MTRRVYNTVLLAEDDEDDRIFFTEALRNILPDVSLHMSENGEAIIRLFEDRSVFDIIFLDLNLPRYSGQQILEHIRNSAVLKDTLVVMITTCNTFTHINDCHKLGANFYIVKPFSFSGLSLNLEECFARIDKFGATQPPMSEFLIQTPALH